MNLRQLYRLVPVIIFLLFFILIFKQEWPSFGDEDYQLSTITNHFTFDYLIWEANAIGTKAEAILSNSHTYLDEATRQQIVLDTIALISEIQQIEAEISYIYTNPNELNPDAASAQLQQALIDKRKALADMQPLAEAIVQEQVGIMLKEEGFEVLGQTWPPVMMYMSPLPSLLIISPRDKIERENAMSLVPGVPVPEQERMETAVFENLDKSALVVPIGGMATYPAMIMETSSINWLSEVTAHEWSHHWMGFHPIGLNYSDPQLRTINETVASTIDQEIRDKVIVRYFPDYMPQPSPTTSSSAPAAPAAPSTFDFQSEMAQTRIRADELLAEGKIEEAEAYMEEQRVRFVENGYPIRKLNQAYFAFYGAYADRPGATGSDPTGPMIRDIRAASPSLRAFMDTMAQVGSFADLEKIWEELKDPTNEG